MEKRVERDSLDLAGLSGGKKQHWLRVNAELVVQYYEAFGGPATLERFVLKADTLEHLLTEHQAKILKRSEAEKLGFRVDYLIESLNETRTEVRGLKRDYGRFTEVVADTISRQFLEPLLRHIIQIPESLELKPKDDPLRIDDI